MGRVDAVFGSFAGTDENDGDVVAVEGCEMRVAVDIDFAKDGMEFMEKRQQDELGVFAKMTTWTGVEGDLERRRGGGHGTGWE